MKRMKVQNKLTEKPKVIGVYLYYDNGDKINIQDLSKEDYEKFLEQMFQLRIAYNIILNKK